MSATTTAIAGGSTGSLPDSNVAIDRVASADYQRVKLADATADSTSPVGVDANPLKVRQRRAGTSDYDSGIVTVGTGAPASVTTATIYPEQGYISNVGLVQRLVTLTNTAGTTFFAENIAPNNTVPFPCGGALVGLKAGSDGAGIVLSVFGAQ